MGQLPPDNGTPNRRIYGTIEELCPIEAILMRGRIHRKPNENGHLPKRQVAVDQWRRGADRRIWFANGNSLQKTPSFRACSVFTSPITATQKLPSMGQPWTCLWNTMKGLAGQRRKFLPGFFWDSYIKNRSATVFQGGPNFRIPMRELKLVSEKEILRQLWEQLDYAAKHP